jgi:hypothetical protein
MSYKKWYDVQMVYLDIEKDIKYDLNVDVELDYEIDLKVDKDIDIDIDVETDVDLDGMFADATYYAQNTSDGGWITGGIQTVTGDINTTKDGDQHGSLATGFADVGSLGVVSTAEGPKLAAYNWNSAEGTAVAIGKASYAEFDIQVTAYDAGSTITMHAQSATDYFG